MGRKWIGGVVAVLLAVGLLGALPAPVARAATCTSQATGNWSAASTWADCGGGIPQNGDNVVIASGHTVTVDTTTAALANLTVNGILRFDETGTGRTMTVTGNLTIASGGTLDVATGGTTTVHSLLLAGNLSHSGTLNAKPSSGTSVINFTFNGTSDQTVSGSNPTTTRFNKITLDKGSVASKVVASIRVNTFAGTNTFTWNNGTWEQTAARLDINNGNQTITANGALVISGSGRADYPDSLIIDGGALTVNSTNDPALNVGSGNNRLEVMTGSATFTAGTVNINGRLTLTGGSTTINGATIRIDPQGTNSLGASNDVFGAAAAASLTMSSGTITLVDPLAATGAGRDIWMRNGDSSNKSLTGGTIFLGDGTSNSAGADGFEVDTDGTGDARPSLFNLTVNGPSSGRVVKLIAGLKVDGNLTINAGGELNANDKNINIKGNWTNNGTFTSGTGTVTFNGNTAQTLGGASVTSFNSLTVNNSGGSGIGVTLGQAAVVNGTLTLSGGRITLGPYDLTLGPSATNAGSPNANKMVVADGAGALCKRYDATGSYTFPVGDVTGTAEYSPATLNFTGGTFSSGQACVRVTDAIHPNMPGSDYVTRYWTVTQSGISGFTCAVAFTYLNADIAGSEANLSGAKWDGLWTVLDPVDQTNNQIVGTVTGFSDFSAGNPGILAVTLAAFTADVAPAGVALTWETVSEADNAGFRVWRSEAADGERSLLAFVPATAPGSTAGGSYSYVDTTAQPGRTYWYWLEDVDLSGATALHGPVSVTYAEPTALRLAGFRGTPSNAVPFVVTTSVVTAALAVAWLRRRQRNRNATE